MKSACPTIAILLLAISQASAGPADSGRGQQSGIFQRLFGPHGGPLRSTPGNGSGTKQTPQDDWDLYPFEKLPVGMVFNEADITKLPIGDYNGKLAFLTGKFVVTASGANRSMMRPQNSPGGLRIVVFYSPLQKIDDEGSRLAIDQSSGLVIQRLARAENGPLTVFVKKILQP